MKVSKQGHWKTLLSSWCCHQNVCLCPDSGEAGTDRGARGGGQLEQDRQEDDGRRGVSDS